MWGGWKRPMHAVVWRDRDSLPHLNFEYFLCLMSLEHHLAHHWQNIWYSHNVINIFAVKLEIIFLRWCGKARKVSELISKPNLCTWSFLLLEIWFNPGTSNVRLFVSDEDQEPSQPANLNLAVLLFSAIIYHCGRHQAPAQHQLVYLSGGPGKSWRAEKFLHHASVLGRFCQHFSLKNPSFFHHGQFWLQFKLDK